MKQISQSDALARYIQFAIDNGYNVAFKKWEILEEWDLIYIKHIGEWKFDWYFVKLNIEKEITSRSFIEALTRGVIKNNLWDNLFNINIFTKEEFEKQILEENKRHKDITTTMYYISIKNEITTQLAFAIRDEKLGEFITNLLK